MKTLLLSVMLTLVPSVALVETDQGNVDLISMESTRFSPAEGPRFMCPRQGCPVETADNA